MMNQKQKGMLAIALVIVVVWLLKNPSENELMTFYDHKECLVYGGYMAGCEGSGVTYTTYFKNKDNWHGHGSCTDFMNAYGCKPQNCNYMNGGECDGWNAFNVLPRDCDTDEDCIERFGNTAYRCRRNECIFEGNHIEKDEIEITGIEAKPNTELNKKNPVLAMAGAIVFMYLLGGFHNPANWDNQRR